MRNTWPGWEYERDWSVCVDCGTRRPRAALSATGECQDRAWCEAARRERAARRPTPALPPGLPPEEGGEGSGG